MLPDLIDQAESDMRRWSKIQNNSESTYNEVIEAGIWLAYYTRRYHSLLEVAGIGLNDE